MIAGVVALGSYVYSRGEADGKQSAFEEKTTLQTQRDNLQKLNSKLTADIALLTQAKNQLEAEKSSLTVKLEATEKALASAPSEEKILPTGQEASLAHGLLQVYASTLGDIGPVLFVNKVGQSVSWNEIAYIVGPNKEDCSILTKRGDDKHYSVSASCAS